MLLKSLTAVVYMADLPKLFPLISVEGTKDFGCKAELYQIVQGAAE